MHENRIDRSRCTADFRHCERGRKSKLPPRRPPKRPIKSSSRNSRKATGHKVTTILIPARSTSRSVSRTASLYDLIIMAGPAIDDQIKLGKAVAGSRVDFAQSGTGMAVKKGAPKPDIGSVDAFKKALLATKSIGYSTGPSGIYMLSVFEKLGIADQVKGQAQANAVRRVRRHADRQRAKPRSASSRSASSCTSTASITSDRCRATCSA